MNLPHQNGVVISGFADHLFETRCGVSFSFALHNRRGPPACSFNRDCAAHLMQGSLLAPDFPLPSPKPQTLPTYRRIGVALFPLMYPITCATAYFGGIAIIMCTWSDNKCPSSI